jgi:hypothetical protein
MADDAKDAKEEDHKDESEAPAPKRAKTESSEPSEPPAESEDRKETAAPAPAPAPAAEIQDDMGVAMGNLSPAIQQKLSALFDSGKCPRQDLESCCIDSLKDFTEDVSIQIIDKFLEADLSTIRSKTAFFIGILKRFRKDKQSGGGATGGGGGMGMPNMVSGC